MSELASVRTIDLSLHFSETRTMSPNFLFICALLLVALASSNAYPTAIESPQEDAASLQTRLGLHNIIDMVKHSLDRLLNKLVDETHLNFPDLRQAIEDFAEAVKDFRLHKLTHAALMKTLTFFTKGLFEVRNQLAEVEKLKAVVKWIDERVKGLCYVLSMYGKDCGYPDVDTVGN